MAVSLDRTSVDVMAVLLVDQTVDQKAAHLVDQMDHTRVDQRVGKMVVG